MRFSTQPTTCPSCAFPGCIKGATAPEGRRIEGAHLNHITTRKDMGMSKYGLCNDLDLVVKSRQTAYCALCRLNGGAGDMRPRKLKT